MRLAVVLCAHAPSLELYRSILIVFSVASVAGGGKLEYLYFLLLWLSFV